MTEYDTYLERYCKEHEITRDEAEKHNIVKDVKEYYRSRKGDKYDGE